MVLSYDAVLEKTNIFSREILDNNSQQAHNSRCKQLGKGNGWLPLKIESVLAEGNKC